MFELIYRFDPEDSTLPRMPYTADEARQCLVEGNADFARLTKQQHKGKESRVIPFDPRALGWGLEDAPMQAPFAAVLGCADARVPTEMVFCKGCNDLFVVRVAGNVLGDECLGSLRYAVHHFPDTLKLLVVLAHSQCGAVTEAVDIYLEPRRYLAMATDHSVRSIEDQILVAVRTAALALDGTNGPEVKHKRGYRAGMIESAIVLNAAWSAYCLKKEFRDSFPDIGVVFGMYDLVSHHVRLPLSPPNELTPAEKNLFAPPEDVEGFRQLATRVGSGRSVQRLLERG